MKYLCIRVFVRRGVVLGGVLWCGAGGAALAWAGSLYFTYFGGVVIFVWKKRTGKTAATQLARSPGPTNLSPNFAIFGDHL